MAEEVGDSRRVLSAIGAKRWIPMGEDDEGAEDDGERMRDELDVYGGGRAGRLLRSPSIHFEVECALGTQNGRSEGRIGEIYDFCVR